MTPDQPHAITIPHETTFLVDPSDWMQICLRIDNPPVQLDSGSLRAMRIFETTHQKTLIMAVSENFVNPTDEGGGIDVITESGVFASGDTGDTVGDHPGIFFVPNAGLAYYLNGQDRLPKDSEGDPALLKGMRPVPQAWHNATVPLDVSIAPPAPESTNPISSCTSLVTVRGANRGQAGPLDDDRHPQLRRNEGAGIAVQTRLSTRATRPCSTSRSRTPSTGC